jgi:hypothetical protein
MRRAEDLLAMVNGEILHQVSAPFKDYFEHLLVGWTSSLLEPRTGQQIRL